MTKVDRFNLIASIASIASILGFLCYLWDKASAINTSKQMTVQNYFHAGYGEATGVFMLLIVILALLRRQHKMHKLFEEKILALRELRNIDVSVVTHQIIDLNEQNKINNLEIKNGFKRVGIDMRENVERQALPIIEQRNKEIKIQQEYLNSILEKEL